MLTKTGQVKITDFGLASVEELSVVTEVGTIIGTRWYMAPEQIQGYTVDNRADVYALGITLYELLTDTVPFSKGDLAYRHIHEKPRPPIELNRAISPAMNALILKCLEKKADDRFQDCAEILRALQ